MVSRRELRGIIEVEMALLQQAESRLTNQWQSLERSGKEARCSFLSSVQALEHRAKQLEELIELLGSEAHHVEPLAA